MTLNFKRATATHYFLYQNLISTKKTILNLTDSHHLRFYTCSSRLHRRRRDHSLLPHNRRNHCCCYRRLSISNHSAWQRADLLRLETRSISISLIHCNRRDIYSMRL